MWREHTQGILDHLQKYRGVSPVVLLKFIIEDNDARAFVQEGDEYVWFKMNTRKPLGDYRREDYRLPEVVVAHPISLEEISIVDPIPKFA